MFNELNGSERKVLYGIKFLVSCCEFVIILYDQVQKGRSLIGVASRDARTEPTGLRRSFFPPATASRESIARLCWYSTIASGKNCNALTSCRHCGLCSDCPSALWRSSRASDSSIGCTSTRSLSFTIFNATSLERLVMMVHPFRVLGIYSTNGLVEA
jgi:hypothetical protein